MLSCDPGEGPDVHCWPKSTVISSQFSALSLSSIFIFIFEKYFIYLFLEREEVGGERKGEKHQCVVASRVPATGDLACSPEMCPDWESNPLLCSLVLSPLSHTSQGPEFKFLSGRWIGSSWSYVQSCMARGWSLIVQTWYLRAILVYQGTVQR